MLVVVKCLFAITIIRLSRTRFTLYRVHVAVITALVQLDRLQRVRSISVIRVNIVVIVQ